MDARWESLEVTENDLLTAAEWIQEQRSLHHSCFPLFRMAGKLIAISVNDYEIATAAFCYAVLGLERSLRLHYSDAPHHATEKFSLAELMQRSVDDGVIADDNFVGGSPSFPFFKHHADSEFKAAFQRPKYSEVLATLIPQLRNTHMHGGHIMFADAVPLSLHLRQFADSLNTTKQ